MGNRLGIHPADLLNKPPALLIALAAVAASVLLAGCGAAVPTPQVFGRQYDKAALEPKLAQQVPMGCSREQVLPFLKSEGIVPKPEDLAADTIRCELPAVPKNNQHGTVTLEFRFDAAGRLNSRSISDHYSSG